MKEALRRELLRKTIHLSGVTVPVVYYFFNRDYALLYTSLALISFVVLEYIRIRAHSIFPFVRTADSIQRQREKIAMAANVYFCIAAVISIYFLGDSAIVIGLSTALISDAAAAITGVGLGRHLLKNGKSLEGSVGGVLTAIFISSVLGADLITSLVLGGIFLFVDLLDFGFDDNFTMPLLMALTVQVMRALPWAQA